jgi:hypothetical protein
MMYFGEPKDHLSEMASPESFSFRNITAARSELSVSLVSKLVLGGWYRQCNSGTAGSSYEKNGDEYFDDSQN